MPEYPRLRERIHTYAPTASASKIQFLDPSLTVDPLNCNLWITEHPWSFAIGHKVFTVPANFTTDFFSIPPVLRAVWPRNPGAISIAALIHDYLIRYRRIIGVTIPEANAALRDCLTFLGYPLRGQLFWIATSAFGWIVAGPGDGTPPASHTRLLRITRQ